MASIVSQGPLEPWFSAVEEVKAHWVRFLLLGLFLVALGIGAVGAATATTLVTIYFIALTLMVGGITKLIYTFWARQWNGFFLSLLGGLLYTGAGILLVAKPVQAAAALTLLIGSLFLVSGFFKIAASLIYRFEQWGWVLFSGIVSLALGALVLVEWPATSLWLIGLFVGIDLIFYGWTWVLLAIVARRSRSTG